MNAGGPDPIETEGLMKLKVLIGAGDRVMALTLPSAVVLNILRPAWFHLGWGNPDLPLQGSS